MKMSEIDQFLLKSLEDTHVSRTERLAFNELLSRQSVKAEQLHHIRARAFYHMKSHLNSPTAGDALDWLEKIVKRTYKHALDAQQLPNQAWFSPGNECRQAIIEQLTHATESIDICVFTITDDAVTRQIEAAHRRLVPIRIITDDDKSEDRGSDIERLERMGVAVRMDHTQHHMHHKFALFDNQRLLTGSYNWTRSASAHNNENIALLYDPALIRSFGQEFDRLWSTL